MYYLTHRFARHAQRWQVRAHALLAAPGGHAPTRIAAAGTTRAAAAEGRAVDWSAGATLSGFPSHPRLVASVLCTLDGSTPEDVLLLRAIRDMNAPKFIAQDMPLFNALMSDLFPGVEPPTVDYGSLQVVIEAELDGAGLMRVPSIIRKCIQTYESKLTRHGNMLVGA